jgi:hypothetical protein
MSLGTICFVIAFLPTLGHLLSGVALPVFATKAA